MRLQLAILAAASVPLGCGGLAASPADASADAVGDEYGSAVDAAADRTTMLPMADAEASDNAANDAELESVEGVGEIRAKDIREGLRRLQEINLVDRYLQT